MEIVTHPASFKRVMGQPNEDGYEITLQFQPTNGQGVGQEGGLTLTEMRQLRDTLTRLLET